MFPLVRVGATVSVDFVTSTRLFAIRYTITSLASVRLLAKVTQVQDFDHGGHNAASTVVTLHEAGSLSLPVLHRCDTVDAYSTMGLTSVW